MQKISEFVRKRPRFTAAITYVILISLAVHFTWYSTSRMNGMVPALTLGIGIAHALAGAINGKRLIDLKRTKTTAHAMFLGAINSLFAFAIFSPAMAFYVSTSNAGKSNILQFVLLSILTGFFAFLAVGWALLLLSVAIAIGLHRIAANI
jgi:hypothetical protein